MKILDPNTISINNIFLRSVHEMLPAQPNEDDGRRGIRNSKYCNRSIWRKETERNSCRWENNVSRLWGSALGSSGSWYGAFKAKHLLRSWATVSFWRETPYYDVKEGSYVCKTCLQAWQNRRMRGVVWRGACIITGCNMRCFNDYGLQTADAALIANCGRLVSLKHANTGIQNSGRLHG